MATAIATGPLDMAIVGGGLAGGLIALAVHRARPDLSLALVEAGATLGGNHRWSWFEGDLEGEAADLLACFEQTRWDTGYDVRFPGVARHLGAGYRSLASEDFDAGLRRLLPDAALRLGRRVTGLAADGLTFEGGERIDARAVIDCRGFVPTPHLRGGWQKFVGRHLRTRRPHGVTAPVIMDADCAQHGAYRFVYVLPLAEDEIFVEDTYYADHPQLDRAGIAERIAVYCARHGWEGEVIGEEAGVLPVLTDGDGAAHRRALGTAGVALAGVRGLFAHPLTSYSLPMAAHSALAIAAAADRPGPALADFVAARAQEHWKATRFYRDLARMLFLAAEPEARWRIFAHFYRLPEPLIARFYAGRSSRFDSLRVLTGKPPVPISRAIAALLGKGAPLVQGPAQ